MNFSEKVLEEIKAIRSSLSKLPGSWMAMEECAKHLCISKNTLYSMVSEHKIPCYRIGKRIVFKTCEIDKWMEKNCRVRTSDEVNMDVTTDMLTRNKDA